MPTAQTRQRLTHRTTWLLRPTASAQARGYLNIALQPAAGATSHCLLPIGAGLNFYLHATHAPITIAIAPDEATLAPTSWLAGLFARFRRRFTRLKRGVLNFNGLETFPAGPKQHYKSYCRHLRIARLSLTPPDGKIMRAHPELITGWPVQTSRAPIAATAPAQHLAVALHLHYPDLWPEIATLLGRWTLPFTLFVTLTQENPDLARQIITAFPGSIIRIVENSGRDVRPFLLLLEDGAFDGFDLVCKIHGKKSLSHGRIPIFGDIWRRVAFLDLIATDQQLQKIISLFGPNTGIIGPRRLHAASTPTAPRDLLGQNRPMAQTIATLMNFPIHDDAFDFFEGTMFWVRPQALEPLRRLRVSAMFQSIDAGRGDGALEHALERLFNHAARAAGFGIADVTGEAE